MAEEVEMVGLAVQAGGVHGASEHAASVERGSEREGFMGHEQPWQWACRQP